MRKTLQNYSLIFLGWIFVVLGIIGVMLPLLPTTPFLIVALGLFAKSSPRFHQMLLNNTWFGPSLQQWEESRTMSRHTKYKAWALIIVTFSVSAALLAARPILQLLLLVIGLVLIYAIWRIRETPAADK